MALLFFYPHYIQLFHKLYNIYILLYKYYIIYLVFYILIVYNISMSDFIKNDSNKLQWSLVPWEEMTEVVQVLTNGAKKYSRDNWKNCDDVNRYKDALMRHITAYLSGEKLDPEDNCSHLAHAICNCLFLQYFDNKPS